MAIGLLGFILTPELKIDSQLMARTHALVLSGLVFLITIWLMVMTSSYLNQEDSEFRIAITRPDFIAFTNAADKKNAFFGYLQPVIQRANESILSKRDRLEKIARKQQEQKLGKSDLRFLDTLTDEYGIGSSEPSVKKKIELLQLRVDQVPVSLALAQAARESGWGTSRFARDALNYFGQWCYQPGCGLVPKQRPEGATHEIRKFDHVADSVDAYLKNINTHKSYEGLRKLRATLRSNGQVSGLELAKGLGSYSQRGKIYVKEIQSMIRFNNLDEKLR